MTMTRNTTSEVVQKLISSCRQTQQGFQCAAEAVDNAEMGAKFRAYNPVTARFAEELSQHLPPGMSNHGDLESYWDSLETSEVLRKCLDEEKHSLDLYSQALASGGMPTRAHFLVSAQYSLLRRVHDRVTGLFQGESASAKGA